MSANNDVGQAILAAWNGANLDTVVAGGIKADKRPSPRPTEPYATLEVRKDARPNEYSSNGSFIDYRRVKITLYGIGKTAIGAVVSQIRQAIEGTQGNLKKLNVANATWMRTEPIGDDLNLSQAVQGEDVRECPLEWIVWTHRNNG